MAAGARLATRATTSSGRPAVDDEEARAAAPALQSRRLALSFPIGCMIAHALNGHPEMNESIEVYINALIGTYCSKMTEAGKTEQEVAHIVRNIARWCGWFQYLAFHILNVQDLFPVESQKSKDYIHDAVGVLGLKLMRLSYDTDYVAASTPAGEVQTEEEYHSA